MDVLETGQFEIWASQEGWRPCLSTVGELLAQQAAVSFSTPGVLVTRNRYCVFVKALDLALRVAFGFGSWF